MKSSVKYLLIAAVAVMIIVPSVYVIEELQTADSRATDPVNYLPSTSTAVAMITDNGTTYYPFVVNGTVGVALQASLTAIASGKSAAKLNITSPMLSETSNYRGYSIFKISNVNVLSLFHLGLNATMMGYVDGFLNSTNLSGITNVSIYASNPSSSVTIVGELQAVYHSLDAYTEKTSMDPSALSTPNNANFSLYYAPHSMNLSYVSANLTSSNLTIRIGFTNAKLAEETYLAYLATSPGEFQMRIVGSSTLIITISNQTFMSVVNVNNLFRLVNLSGFAI